MRCSAAARFRLLQRLDERFLQVHFTQEDPEYFIAAVCTGFYEGTPEEMKAAYLPDVTDVRRPSLDDRALTAVETRIRFLRDAGAIRHTPSLTRRANCGFCRRRKSSWP